MRKKRTQTTKAKIVSAAWKLFYEQGYEDTTVDDIVYESGTSKGSFYHYFSGKDALLGSLSFMFDEKYEELGDEVQFLMVNLTDGQRETVEVAKSYIASQGYTFPVYFDTKYEAAYTYGVSSIPQTYFINADGSLEARATGMISAAQLEKGIGMIYSE